ncbi:MAG: hypothetical protein J6573_05500 [Lactobacillus sp.]|nr:hypothetical protein [Lactobacillus sp.]
MKIILNLLLVLTIYPIICAVLALFGATWKYWRQRRNFKQTFSQYFFDLFLEILNPLNWLYFF